MHRGNPGLTVTPTYRPRSPPLKRLINPEISDAHKKLDRIEIPTRWKLAQLSWRDYFIARVDPRAIALRETPRWRPFPFSTAALQVLLRGSQDRVCAFAGDLCAATYRANNRRGAMLNAGRTG